MDFSGRTRQVQAHRHLRKVSRLTAANQILTMKRLSQRNASWPCQSGQSVSTSLVSCGHGTFNQVLNLIVGSCVDSEKLASPKFKTFITCAVSSLNNVNLDSCFFLANVHRVSRAAANQWSQDSTHNLHSTYLPSQSLYIRRLWGVTSTLNWQWRVYSPMKSLLTNDLGSVGVLRSIWHRSEQSAWLVFSNNLLVNWETSE